MDYENGNNHNGMNNQDQWGNDMGYNNGWDNGQHQQQQWGPQLNKEAICCMPGMECWNSSYENTAGRQGLADELAMLQAEFPRIQDRFDELNAENVEKARVEREDNLAEARKQSRQLNNKVEDTQTRLDKINAVLARGGATAEQEAEAATLVATLAAQK